MRKKCGNSPLAGHQCALRFGEISSYAIFNFATTYNIERTDTDLYFTIKTLFDKQYVVDRTRGILPIPSNFTEIAGER